MKRFQFFYALLAFFFISFGSLYASSYKFVNQYSVDGTNAVKIYIDGVESGTVLNDGSYPKIGDFYFENAFTASGYGVFSFWGESDFLATDLSNYEFDFSELMILDIGNWYRVSVWSGDWSTEWFYFDYTTQNILQGSDTTFIAYDSDTLISTGADYVAPASDTSDCNCDTFKNAVSNVVPDLNSGSLSSFDSFEIKDGVLNIRDLNSTVFGLSLDSVYENNISKVYAYTTKFNDDFFGNCVGYVSYQNLSFYADNSNFTAGAVLVNYEPVSFYTLLEQYLIYSSFTYDSLGVTFISGNIYNIGGIDFKLVYYNSPYFKNVYFLNDSLGTISFRFYKNDFIVGLVVKTLTKKALFKKAIQ